MARGDWPTAQKQLEKAVHEGDHTAWYNLGTVFFRRGDKSNALNAITVAARYGDPRARTYLAQNRLTVPPVDLPFVDNSQAARAATRSAQDSSEGAAILLQGLADMAAASNSALTERARDEPTRSPSLTCTERGGPVMAGTIKPATQFDCR